MADVFNGTPRLLREASSYDAINARRRLVHKYSQITLLGTNINSDAHVKTCVVTHVLFGVM